MNSRAAIPAITIEQARALDALDRRGTFASAAALLRCGHSSVLYAINCLSKDIEEKGSKLKRQLEHVSRRLDTSCLS